MHGFFLWILSCWQKFYGPPCFCLGGNTESPRHFVQAITSIACSESPTKNPEDSVLILTHQKTVEVSLLGHQVSKQNDRNEQLISRSR